jgi:hypothetical protein
MPTVMGRARFWQEVHGFMETDTLILPMQISPRSSVTPEQQCMRMDPSSVLEVLCAQGCHALHVP